MGKKYLKNLNSANDIVFLLILIIIVVGGGAGTVKVLCPRLCSSSWKSSGLNPGESDFGTLVVKIIAIY